MTAPRGVAWLALDELAARLNDRSRRVLGWRTPAEVFTEAVSGAMSCPVSRSSQGQGPVLDDALHDEGGAETLDAGESGEG